MKDIWLIFKQGERQLMTSYQKLKAKIERLERHIRLLILEEENPNTTATLTQLYRIRFMTEDAILFGCKNKKPNDAMKIEGQSSTGNYESHFNKKNEIL